MSLQISSKWLVLVPGGLHEMIVHVVAIDQGQLEQRLEQAVRIHKLAADRSAALLSQAEARAATAERLQRQAEARHASLPQQPTTLSVQVQQVSSTESGCLRNARTQTPTRMVAQVSVASQVPSSGTSSRSRIVQLVKVALLIARNDARTIHLARFPKVQNQKVRSHPLYATTLNHEIKISG